MIYCSTCCGPTDTAGCCISGCAGRPSFTSDSSYVTQKPTTVDPMECCVEKDKRIEELTAVIEGDLESFKMAGELYTARKRIEKLEAALKACDPINAVAYQSSDYARRVSTIIAAALEDTQP